MFIMLNNDNFKYVLEGDEIGVNTTLITSENEWCTINI